jgi:hypothetical protein
MGDSNTWLPSEAPDFLASLAGLLDAMRRIAASSSKERMQLVQFFGMRAANPQCGERMGIPTQWFDSSEKAMLLSVRY